jgi:hypothetical protein
MLASHCFLSLTSACLLQAQSVSPESLTAHLKGTVQLHMNFTQTRTLAALSKPLKTTGSFVLAKGRGVIWQVRKPLSLTYVISPATLLEVGPDGKATRKDPKDVPMVAQMGRIFEALFEGHWKALDDTFTVKPEGTPGHWKITLTPRSRKLETLKEIQLTGAGSIERIQVQEPSGDGMELAFERPDSDSPLSEEEQRLLRME